MIYAIAIFTIVGIALVWWVKSLSGTGYDADGNMWLVMPMLAGWASLVIAILLAVGWGAWTLYHHIKFH